MRNHAEKSCANGAPLNGALARLRPSEANSHIDHGDLAPAPRHANKAPDRQRKLPPTGYLRLRDIIGEQATEDSKGIAPIIPVSRSTWWAGVRSGRFPQPSRALGLRIAAWRVESILALVEQSSLDEGA